MQNLFQQIEVAKNSSLIASLSHEFHLTKMPSLFGLFDSFFATSYWTGEEFLLQMNYMWHNMDLFERTIWFRYIWKNVGRAMKKYTKVGTFHEKKHWNCNKSWTIQKPNKYEILGPYVLGLLENMCFVSISLLLAEI